MSFSVTTGRATMPRARTLVEMFDATAVRCGDRVALDGADVTLTYRELFERALGVAGRLTGLGVGPGDRVGVQVQSGTSELYVAILGVLQSGAAYVPVDADDPPARAADLFERAGACVVVRDGQELGPWLSARGVTVVSTVPTLAAMWDDDALAGVRLLILGGEACPEPLGWRLAAGREVWNTYGPTEATVVSTAARIQPGEPVTIGWPLDGWEVAVLDERGQLVAAGEPGELVIAGAGVARYLDPVLDTERFAPVPSLGWERAYCTGDIVRETDDGLVFVGRRDQQVKVGGRRIELGEIDAQLGDLPGVRAAVTVLRESSAGNKLLVSYVAGAVDSTKLRDALAQRLPTALVPVVVALDELPLGASRKVDRNALPWPPGAADDVTRTARFTGTADWLAEHWIDQLGPVEIALESDFFALGGSSLAAAKLTSALRERFAAVAVADIYNHRRLAELSARLDQLGSGSQPAPAQYVSPGRRWGAIQLAGVVVLLVFAAAPWLLAILAFDRLSPGLGPQVGIGWVWLIAGWLVLVSAPGRTLIVIVARRLLLAGLKPGRYPRNGWLACRIWFVERLAEICHLDALAGTPWAARYARLGGARVGPGARLGTLPPPTSLVSIGDGATLEPDVDLHGWSIDGQELVIGELWIGDVAVGTRSLLMPGSSVGAGAEIEPGSLVTGDVPAGQRWAGAPARRVGAAGDGWPEPLAARNGGRLGAQAIYAAGLTAHNLLLLLASVPGIVLLATFSPGRGTTGSLVTTMIMLAPLLALTFVLAYALLVAVAVRAVSPLIRPGWHRDDCLTGWALWFTETIMAGLPRAARWRLAAAHRTGHPADLLLSEADGRQDRKGRLVRVAEPDRVRFRRAR